MKKLPSSFALLLILSACGEQEQIDTVKPAIEINSPAENQVYSISDTDKNIICINVDFADNEHLKSFKIDIHSAAGHTHPDMHSAATKSEDLQMQNDKFSYISSEIEGQRNANVDKDVAIQGVTAGDYHVGLYCLDESGNESVAWRTVTIAE